ncbi:MAG TPA: HD domain-containing protein, partial [Cyclobacteriaceae bacterium]|nr:HD domain-containing protein [Cyclobacteriaceae bacterium]
MNKKKIINDPVYGFIAIPGDLIYDLIQHPYFQRLRYIKQLGLSDLVYPGAHHTRFHHALGAMHLMGRVLKTLQQKGVEISDAEAEAAQVAILLHDIGHGPFSHALEETLL